MQAPGRMRVRAWTQGPVSTRASPLDIRHGTLVVDDPYTLGTACEVKLVSDEEIDRTLDRARRAAKAWRNTAVKQRVALVLHFVSEIERRKEEIAADLAAM